MGRVYEISGYVESVVSCEKGVSRVAIKSLDSGTKRAEIIFFGELDRRYAGRVVDFKEESRPNGSLYQRLYGADFDERAEASKEEVEKFRNRTTFIPQLVVELEDITN